MGLSGYCSVFIHISKIIINNFIYRKRFERGSEARSPSLAHTALVYHYYTVAIQIQKYLD